MFLALALCRIPDWHNWRRRRNDFICGRSRNRNRSYIRSSLCSRIYGPG